MSFYGFDFWTQCNFKSTPIQKIKDENHLMLKSIYMSRLSQLWFTSFTLILELIDLYFRAVIPCYYRGCHVMHDDQVSCVFLSSILVGSQHCLYSALIMVWETHQED